jgi:hypothetical protein
MYILPIICKTKIYIIQKIMKSTIHLFLAITCMLMLSHGIQAQKVPVADFAYQLGTELTDYGAKILHDNLGNIYVGGNFQGSPDFDLGTGKTTLPNKGSHDIAIAKYNSERKLLWVNTFASNGYDILEDLKITGDGSLLVLGSCSEVLFFSSNSTPIVTSDGVVNAFLARMDASGNLTWAKGINQTGKSKDAVYVYPSSLATDSKQNIYITGRFSGTIDFDKTSATDDLSTTNSKDDFFLAKYTSNGTFTESKSFGSDGIDAGTSVITDAQDNVYITGYYSDSLDLDLSSGKYMLYSYDKVTKPSINSFIVKYNSNGSFVWARGIYGNSDVFIAKAAMTAANEIFLFGQCKDTLFTTGGSKKILQHGTNYYLAKYSAAGNNEWIQGILAGSVIGYEISFDENSNPVIAGAFGGQIYNYGQPSVRPKARGYNDIYILKYSNAGNYEWFRSMGKENDESGKGIDLFPGGFYLIGDFRETTDLNPYGTPLLLSSVPDNIGAADPDVFFAKYHYCDISFSSVKVSEMCSYTSPGGKVWTKSGIYTDTIINKSGCDSIITINLTILLKNTITVTNTSCPESQDGKIIVNTSGGTSPYIYEGISNAVVKPSSLELKSGKGIYILKTTNGGGNSCSVYDTIQISGPQFKDLCEQYKLSDITLCAGQQTVFYPGILKPGFRAVWTKASGTSDTIFNPAESGKSVQLFFKESISTFKDTGVYKLTITDLRTGSGICKCPQTEVKAKINLNGYFTVSDKFVYRKDSSFVRVSESEPNKQITNQYGWYTSSTGNDLIGKTTDQDSIWLKLPLNSLTVENENGRNQVELWVEDLTAQETTLLKLTKLTCSNPSGEGANYYKQLLVIDKPLEFTSFQILPGNLGFSGTFNFNAEIYSNSTRQVWNGSQMVNENFPGTKIYSGKTISVKTSGGELITIPVSKILSPGNYWFTVSTGAPNSVTPCTAKRDTMFLPTGERVARTGNIEKFSQLVETTPFRNVTLRYGNFSTCKRVSVKIKEFVRTCSSVIPSEVETADAAGNCSVPNSRAYTYFGSKQNKLIAGLNDQNKDLGNVSASQKISPSNPVYETRVLSPKLVTLSSDKGTINGPVSIRLFFTEKEIQSLLSHYPGADFNDLIILSFPALTNGKVANGSASVIQPVIYKGKGSINDSIVYTYEFSVSKLETYALATPTGAVITSLAENLTEDLNSGSAIIPNPVSDILSVKVSDQYIGGKIQIISTSGTIVFKDEIRYTESQFNVSELAQGIYLIRLSNTEFTDTRRILKK